ncbi:MAG TPA: HEAT repeat domain-containing protein [Verrucomicrobiota bacterium]|nr:HEAT repeat domain-containing protein [Verrucomicrobiota bacterium]
MTIGSLQSSYPSPLTCSASLANPPRHPHEDFHGPRRPPLRSLQALGLGQAENPGALPELTQLLTMPSAEIRRLAASAIGKLAGFGADPNSAVRALVPVALRDPHPKTQQYALKALKAYGSAANSHLHDLDNLTANERAKHYVRRAARSAATAIREARRLAEAGAIHRCSQCQRPVSEEELDRRRSAFQPVFCDGCFDEVFLERRNFGTAVELNKTIVAQAGTLAPSDGERLIADWLSAHNIAYRYDERYRILSGHAVRPDLYLPEFELYIEYWGTDTADYKIGMLKKQRLSQREGKRVISIYPSDKARLDTVLRAKLGFFGVHLQQVSMGAPEQVNRSMDLPRQGTVSAQTHALPKREGIPWAEFRGTAMLFHSIRSVRCPPASW